MQKDIIDKISLLLEMAGSTNSYEALKEELSSLTPEIDRKRRKVNQLKKDMVDQKYTNQNERIIDENIKIGIENRLSSLHRSLEDIKDQIDSVSDEEENYHLDIVALEHEQEQLNNFQESLDLKLKTIGSKDKNIYSFYENLVNKNSESLKVNNDELIAKRETYNGIVARLEKVGEKRSNLEEKIAKEEEQLKEIQDVLANPKSYMNEKAKKKDEATIDSEMNALDELEHRRLEIITDPAYIAHEAQELAVNDNRTDALAKIKELVTIVESKPYMETANEDLDSLLEEATNKRDEIASEIDNKQYDGNDLTVMNNRINYLKERKDIINNQIKELEKYIANIDTVEVRKLVDNINSSKEYQKALKTDINEYNKVIKENEDLKTEKKKVSLQAALLKKKEELNNISNIVISYEDDLAKMVIHSKELEENDIQNYHREMNDIDDEISEIEKKTILHSKTKDILAIEKDKANLKTLSDDVAAIAHRKKYTKLPSEIYDEIELSMGSMNEEPVKETTSNNDFVNLTDYRIGTDNAEDPIFEESKVEEKSPEPKKEEKPVIEEPIIVPETPKTDIEPALEPTEVISMNNEPEVIPEEKELAPEVIDETPSSEPEQLIEETPVQLESVQAPEKILAPDELTSVPKTDSLEDIFPTINIDEKEIKGDSIEFPPRDQKKEMKIGNVKPIESPDENKVKSDDIMINNDFNDTSFISFNDLLANDNKDDSSK